MRRPTHPLVKTATALAIAAAAVGSSIPMASAAPAAIPATSETAAASLLAGLAYRGAEHPYLVANEADAQASFGLQSPLVPAAAAALTDNTQALVALLGGAADTSARDALSAALGKRDSTELAYAYASRPGAVSSSDQQQAKTSLAAAEGDISNLLSTRLGVPAGTILIQLKAVDAGDLTQLGLVVNGSLARFAGALKGADASSNLFTALAPQVAAVAGAAGDVTASGAVYRSHLTTAFVEHVQQTGLTGIAIERARDTNGPVAKAALTAEDGNSQRISVLLGGPVGLASQDLAAWRTHLDSGYTTYINYLFSGNNHGILIKANAILTGYVARISSNVAVLAPTVGTAALVASYTDHTSGTEVVFKKAFVGDPTVFATAAEGTMHFADLAQLIASGAVAAGRA